MVPPKVAALSQGKGMSSSDEDGMILGRTGLAAADSTVLLEVGSDLPSKFSGAGLFS
jgi:hypothetical protein